eukprot:352919-Chlamydomonas_euryale.AAC.3
MHMRDTFEFYGENAFALHDSHMQPGATFPSSIPDEMARKEDGTGSSNRAFVATDDRMVYSGGVSVQAASTRRLAPSRVELTRDDDDADITGPTAVQQGNAQCRQAEWHSTWLVQGGDRRAHLPSPSRADIVSMYLSVWLVELVEHVLYIHQIYTLHPVGCNKQGWPPDLFMAQRIYACDLQLFSFKYAKDHSDRTCVQSMIIARSILDTSHVFTAVCSQRRHLVEDGFDEFGQPLAPPAHPRFNCISTKHARKDQAAAVKM